MSDHLANKKKEVLTQYPGSVVPLAMFMSLHNQVIHSGVEPIMLNNWNYLRSAIEDFKTNVKLKHIRQRRGVEGENLIQN